MDVKLRQLRYFKAVVDYRTIAAASEQLHIAQPPLSKQIRQLEQEWGVKLFERVQQRLILTEEGRHLYQRASELLSLSGNINEEMAALGRGTSGRVRVGTVTNGIDRLTRAVSELHAQVPDIRFSFWQGEPLYLERLVHDREIDLAIVQQPVEMPGLEAVTIASLRFAAIFPRHQLSREQITLEELAHHPLLLLRRNSRFGSFERVMRRFQERGLTAQVVAECSDVPIIEAMVQAGIAVALIPVCEETGPLLQSPGLCQVFVTGLEQEHNSLALIRKSGTSLNQTTRKLHDLLCNN